MSDPYKTAQLSLRQGFYLKHGPEFEGILIIVYVLYSVSIVLNLVNFGVRWKRGQIWLFRIYPTPTGPFAIPNPVSAWLIWSTLYYAIGLYFTRFTWMSGIVGSNMKNYTLWIMIVWIPGWLAMVMWGWAAALTPFLSPRGSTKMPLDARLYPKTVTAICLLTIVLSLIAILVQAFLANNKFNRLFSLFTEMDKVLDAASSAYQAGELDLLPTPAAMASAETVFDEAFQDFVDAWIRVFVTWIAIDSILICLFVFAVFVSWRDLRKAIASMQDVHQSWRIDTSMSVMWRFRTLVATSTVITLNFGIYTAIDVPLVIRSVTIKVLHGERITEVLRLGALLSAGVIGGSVNVVLTFITFRLSPSASSRSSGTGTFFRRTSPRDTAVPISVEIPLHDTTNTTLSEKDHKDRGVAVAEDEV